MDKKKRQERLKQLEANRPRNQAQLEALDEFNEKELEGAFTRVMEITGLKLGKIAQPVRVALTGKTASPGIFEIIGIPKTLFSR